jgi:predicted dehydrogenase
VLDLMIHDIDIVLSLVRDHLVDVQALGAAVFGPHEDWAQARLTFANGCVANLAASRVAVQPQRAMQVYTRDGFVTLDFAARRAKVMRPSAAVLRGEIDVNRLSPDEKAQLKERLFIDHLPVEELSAVESNAILEEQRDFLTAIQTGRPARVSGRDGRDALAVAEQIVAALAAHAWDGDEPSRGLRFDEAQPIRRGPHWHQSPSTAPTRRLAG